MLYHSVILDYKKDHISKRIGILPDQKSTDETEK